MEESHSSSFRRPAGSSISNGDRGHAGASEGAGGWSGGSGSHGVRMGRGTVVKATKSSLGSLKSGSAAIRPSGTSATFKGQTCSAQPSRRLSPRSTSARMESIRHRSAFAMALRARHAGGDCSESSSGRRITLRAADAPNLNTTPSSLESRIESGSRALGLVNMLAETTERVAGSATAVPRSAERVHQTKVAPPAAHRRRCCGVRQIARGGGAKSTGAVKRRAPLRYSPTMKAMWKVETSMAQSAWIRDIAIGLFSAGR